jgi:hypothetical protein
MELVVRNNWCECFLCTCCIDWSHSLILGLLPSRTWGLPAFATFRPWSVCTATTPTFWPALNITTSSDSGHTSSYLRLMRHLQKLSLVVTTLWVRRRTVLLKCCFESLMCENVFFVDRLCHVCVHLFLSKFTKYIKKDSLFVVQF